MKKILIVGGVAGGASAAARLRRLDESANIIMFEKGEYISFANCGLPYYIGESITQREALLVQSVEGMSSRFNMDIRNFSEVIQIDKDNKRVRVKNLNTDDIYEENYDYLILSPGAMPIKPQIKGIESAKNLFTLRNIPDTDDIKSFVDNENPKSVAIIGGGFIGLEMAENLSERGLYVTLIQRGNQVMAPIDIEMACIVHNHLIDKGVNLILEDGVTSFEDDGKSIILSSGKTISTDMIILSIGIKPESKIAKEAGLLVNDKGAIVVDEYMQTSDKSIYAVGDAVEVKDYVNGNPTMIPLAWPANRQGRIVADNIIENNKIRYNGTLGSSVAKVFDLTIASTGNNEKTLKKLGINYKAIHIHPASHASYYPGAMPISLKLIFDPVYGNIFGAQAIGHDGVEKRIDVIATAIKGNLKVMDLADLEICYAPPYSSAKDPVNMAGYVATNIIEKKVDIVMYDEIDEIIANGGLLIDVREPEEVSMGAIKGAVNIPLNQIRDKIDEIPKDKEIYVSCQVGLRGYIVSRILTQNGCKVKNLDGGYKTYSQVYKGRKNKELEEFIDLNKLDEKMRESINESNMVPDVFLDTCGLQCPGPITKVYQTIESMNDGEVLQVTSSDTGFAKDIQAWCEKTGNTLVRNDFKDKVFNVMIQKGTEKKKIKS